MRRVTFLVMAALVTFVFSSGAGRVASVASADSSGAVLRQFTLPNPNSSSNGRAMAFDGTHLWATYYGDTRIYELSTGGTLVNTISPSVNFGALAWDATRGVLWGAAYDGSGNVYTVNPVSGIATLAFHFSGGDGYIDGLAYNSKTDSLWVKGDLDTTVYNISPSGTTLATFPISFPGSGIAFDGQGLWISDPINYGVHHFDVNGNALAGDFATPGNQAEGLAYDSVTFAPNCAVWSNEALSGTPTIYAYQVPCGAPDLSHRYVVFLDGINSSSDLTSMLDPDFGDIKQSLQSSGLDASRFVYFSYSAAKAFPNQSQYCATGWNGAGGCTTAGDFAILGLSPTYTSDDTHLPLSAQKDVLNWLLGQIVLKDPKASIDLVGYSLGGVVESYWASGLSTSSPLRAHVHGLVLLESPVGGIPLANSLVQAKCGFDIKCRVWKGILTSLFGTDVLRELQVPTGVNTPPDSIVGGLSNAAKSFPLTSIQSTSDYLVNGVNFPICDNALCTASSSAPVGIGSQNWVGTNETPHFNQQLGGQGLAGAPVGLLYVQGWLLSNHGAPLHASQTFQWVDGAVATG